MKHPPIITREYIRAHPNIIFVFGDNLRQRGTGGQAEVCRGMPNCYGVPTKKLPCKAYPDAFFFDREFELINKDAIDAAIARIPRGREIYVIPGIGEGLSRLKEFAPRTYAYLKERLGELPA